MSLPYPMTPALCQNLGFAAKLISGQEALCPTRIISTLLKLRMQAVLLLQSLIDQRNSMMIEWVPIFSSVQLLGRVQLFAYFRQRIQKQRHHFDDKVLYSQSYAFSNSHVWM